MAVKKKKYILFLILPFALFFAFGTAAYGAVTAYAEKVNLVSGADGVYSVPVDLSGLTMGSDNFSSTATVEKQTTEYGTFYYMTFGHSSSIGSLSLDMGDKQVGYTVFSEDDWTYYTYTLSQTSVQGSLSFSAYITAMRRSVSFTVKLGLTSAERTGDYEYEGERPAEFVPVIQTEAAGEYEAASGSVFSIPSATAALGEETCEVTLSAYYTQNGERTEVTVSENNSITLSEVGEYHIVYRAESESYQTNYGNNTYAEYDVTVTSKAGAITLAKADNLPEGAGLQAGRITNGTVYETAASAMAKVADNFEVFTVSLINADGTETELTESITLYLQADSTYDRTQAVVYRMDSGGGLTKLETNGYGRYVKAETNSAGIFIVCVPGVAFVMPMWGYAVILAACVLVLAVAIVTIVIVIKKKKSKKERS